MPSRRGFAALARQAQSGYTGPMPIRLKKLIGTFLLVALVVIYALVATTIASARLGESGPLVHLAYFFFTGLLWILPAMVIIRWMVTDKRLKR